MKGCKAPSALSSSPQLPSQGGTIPRQGPHLDPHPASPSQGILETAWIISTHRAAPGQRCQRTQPRTLGSPGFLPVSRHFTQQAALPQELVGTPGPAPGGPLLGQRVPRARAWCLRHSLSRSPTGGGGPALDTPRSRGRGRWLQPPGGEGETWQRTDGQRLGSRVQQLFSLSLPKSAGASPTSF